MRRNLVLMGWSGLSDFCQASFQDTYMVGYGDGGGRVWDIHFALVLLLSVCWYGI